MNDNFEITKSELKNAEIIKDIEFELSDKEKKIKEVCDSLNQDFLTMINCLTPVHANLSSNNLIEIFNFFKELKDKNTPMVDFILNQIGLKKEIKKLKNNYIFTIKYEKKQSKIILSISSNAQESLYPKIISTALADILCHYTNG
jgi:vacuolar-type H+-ATPase catalytic subunit A/Vma1